MSLHFVRRSLVGGSWQPSVPSARAPRLAAVRRQRLRQRRRGQPDRAGREPAHRHARRVGLPNPLVATTSAVAWVSAPVVESLYDYDESMKSVPLLAAAEPEISADGLTWTINSRRASPSPTATR